MSKNNVERGIVRKIIVESPFDRPDLMCFEMLLDMEFGGSFYFIFKTIKNGYDNYDYCISILDKLMKLFNVSDINDIRGHRVVCRLKNFNVIIDVEYKGVSLNKYFSDKENEHENKD